MNGFLVSGSCAIDDIPLGLFESRTVAEEFAGKVDADKVIAQAREFGLAANTVLGVDIIEFCGGWPVGRSMVNDFEDAA